MAVDHPDRSSSFPTIPVRPVYLSVEHAQESPIIAHDGLGREVARFKNLADAAHFLKLDTDQPATLPYSIVNEARRTGGEQLDLLAGIAA